jgi:hypothetical protein
MKINNLWMSRRCLGGSVQGEMKMKEISSCNAISWNLKLLILIFLEATRVVSGHTGQFVL